MTWTDEREANLKVMWAEGLPASEIATALGGDLTRSAVLGKAHRLLLPLRKTRHNDTMKAEKPQKTNGGGIIMSIRSRKAERPKLPENMTLDEFNRAIPIEQRVDFMGLRPNTCRWPVGEVGKPGFFFCGAQPMQGRPYCQTHHNFAHGADACSRTAKPPKKFSPIIGACANV